MRVTEILAGIAGLAIIVWLIVVLYLILMLWLEGDPDSQVSIPIKPFFPDNL